MRAGRWPVASLGVPHGGVDGRAGGVRSVQVGQQRAHVQGVGVLDGDLTEDRGVGGKRYAMPGRGGGEEREDVRGPRRGGEHDVGRVRPRERCWGGRDHRTAVYCERDANAIVMRETERGAELRPLKRSFETCVLTLIGCATNETVRRSAWQRCRSW